MIIKNSIKQLTLFLFTAAHFFTTHAAQQKKFYYEEIKNMPKVELHMHLGGSYPLSYLKEIAPQEEYQLLAAEIEKIKLRVDYHAIFNVFKLVSNIVNTLKKVEDGTAALCDALKKDNVVCAEIRTGLKDFGTGYEDYLLAVLRGIAAHAKCDLDKKKIKIRILLSLQRDCSIEIAQKTLALIKKYRNEGVVGLDISGDSTKGDCSAIFSILPELQHHKIPISLHIGESPQENAEQQIKELMILKPEKIGHGVHLCKEAQTWVRENNVLVELCLSSAYLTGMIKTLSEHPALLLFQQGHPIAICTDDPLIFDTNLTDEIALFRYLLDIPIDDFAPFFFLPWMIDLADENE